MPMMVTNKKLEEAKADPSILTNSEIRALIDEVIRSRSYIQELKAKKVDRHPWQ